MQMDNDFSLGLIYGGIATGIICFILGRIREAMKKMGDRNRPLDTFPDAAQPRLTPAGIVRKSTLAMFSCVFWIIILVVVVVIFINTTNALW